MFAVNLIAFAARRVPHFAIGRLYGAAALGLYTVGSEIAHLPATEMIAPMSRAIFPGYARMASDPPQLRQNFLDIISALWIFAFPACFGVAAVAEPLVHTLLGSGWDGAVIVVQVLAVSGAGHAMTSNHFAAWLALGKTRVTALVEAFHLAVLIALMATFARSLGIVGIAYAELGAMVASITLECVLLCRAMGFSLLTYLSALWRPLGAATIMAIAVNFLLEEFPWRGLLQTAPIQLALAGVAGILIYFSLLAIAWLAAGRPRGAEIIALERVVELVQHGRRIHGRFGSRSVETD
jgi:O-antigen/teichoic acid export membrane protein